MNTWTTVVSNFLEKNHTNEGFIYIDEILCGKAIYITKNADGKFMVKDIVLIHPDHMTHISRTVIGDNTIEYDDIDDPEIIDVIVGQEFSIAINCCLRVFPVTEELTGTFDPFDHISSLHKIEYICSGTMGRFCIRRVVKTFGDFEDGMNIQVDVYDEKDVLKSKKFIYKCLE